LKSKKISIGKRFPRNFLFYLKKEGELLYNRGRNGGGPTGLYGRGGVLIITREITWGGLLFGKVERACSVGGYNTTGGKNSFLPPEEGPPEEEKMDSDINAEVFVS